MSARLQATKKYHLFKLYNTNRDVKKIKELKKSMRKHGWIDAYPMHVVRDENGYLEIKGGHHRFEVAQMLGIAVKYVICEDEASIYELETATVAWQMTDYLASGVHCGEEAYIAVKKYHERTGIPVGHCISLLAGHSAGSAGKRDKFKRGTYTLGDPKHAEDVARVVLGCAGKGVTFARNSFFVQAVSRVCRVPKFSIAQFLQRVGANPGLMQKQANLASYMDLIEMVYNRQSKFRQPLTFLAAEEARKRNAVRGKSA